MLDITGLYPERHHRPAMPHQSLDLLLAITNLDALPAGSHLKRPVVMPLLVN
jgi:hypothetical protein